MAKRFFKLINNEVVFGEASASDPSGDSPEILIEAPYTSRGGSVIPYMSEVMGNSPKAIQIHPMNVLWSVPLDEFPRVEKIYYEATSGLIV